MDARNGNGVSVRAWRELGEIDQPPFAGESSLIRDATAFEPGFTSMHGRFADDPVTPRIDFLVVGQLADEVYLATYEQHYDSLRGGRRVG